MLLRHANYKLKFVGGEAQPLSKPTHSNLGFLNHPSHIRSTEMETGINSLIAQMKPKTKTIHLGT